MSVISAPDKPWLMPEVIDWLDSIVKPAWIVLETGCGGSTVFFAQRASRVITYEDNSEWARKVQHELRKQKLTVEWHVDSGYPQFGLDCLVPYDLALIDGRGRVQSVKDALPALKPGGWLLLDDSDRARYAEARGLMDAANSARIMFTSGTDVTTAWRKT